MWKRKYIMLPTIFCGLQVDFTTECWRQHAATKTSTFLLNCYHFSVFFFFKNRISKNKTIGFFPVLLNRAKCCTSTERNKHLSSRQHASERWHNVPSVSPPHIPDCLEFTECIVPSPVAGRMLTTKTVFTGSHVWQATPVKVRGSLLFFYLSYLRCIITHIHW